MKSYPLSQATIRRQLRRAFIRFQIAVIFLLAILAGYLFSDPPLRWLVGLPIFLIVLGIYAWITVLHFRSERRYLHSLRVDLTDRDLRLYSGSRAVKAVSREDVFAVQELHEGLKVSTYDYHNVTVPFGLEDDGDERVRDILSNWTWIRPIPAERYLSDWPLVIGLLVSMTVLVLINSLAPALIFSGALVIYYLVVYLRTRWVNDLDPAVFHSYTMALSFMIFIVFMKLCLLIPISLLH